MSRLLRPVKDPKAILANFEIKTPYGFTLKSFKDFGYSFKYNTRSNNKEYNGLISTSDLAYALEILQKEPDKFRNKPYSIELLEERYSVTAVRKENYLGGWQIITDKYSLFNNPLNLSTGYTDNENNFEIWIFTEEEPRSYNSLQDVLKILDNLQ